MKINSDHSIFFKQLRLNSASYLTSLNDLESKLKIVSSRFFCFCNCTFLPLSKKGNFFASSIQYKPFYSFWLSSDFIWCNYSKSRDFCLHNFVAYKELFATDVTNAKSPFLFITNMLSLQQS